MQKAGCKSFTEAVSVTMATTMWKARNDMDTLGSIFHKKSSVINTRSQNSNNLHLTITGHQEVAANKLAQVWNMMNLNDAKSVGCAKSLAQKWYKESGKNLLK